MPNVEKDALKGEPFAWTPDDEMERGAEEFKRLWPDKWEAWVRWCESEHEDTPTPGRSRAVGAESE